MEKKLTDEEIVKALESCKKDDCDNCPNTFGNCYANLAGYALDLIHRLQEENGNQVRMRCDMQRKFDDLQKLCIEQKAEIEWLKNFIDFKTANVMCDKCKEQAVKDAAKDSLEEFVCAMVNMEYVGVNDDLYYQMLELKDTLLKEKYGVVE
jgi:hypothetical protein